MKIKVSKPPQKAMIDPIKQKWDKRSEFMDEVGKDFLALARARIEREKADPMGKRWAPWAEATARARMREGSASGGLLMRTGALRDSLYYELQGQDKVAIRTQNPYAGYLQNGTRRMPARPFLGTGPKETAALESNWKKWMDKK